MNELQFHWLKVGSCRHPECMVMRGGSLRSQEFPSTVGVLIHPQHGITLLDTGYSEHFHQASQSFPYFLYRWVTPVQFNESDCLLQQLGQLNIQPDDVQQIVISHFHGDHISGLKHFKNSRYLCSQEAYLSIRDAQGFSALLKGFLPDLLPDDFEQRLDFIDWDPSQDLEFIHGQGVDLWGDGLAYLVPLSGHASGQIGILFHHPKRGPVFLIADASWSLQAIAQYRRPNPISYILFDSKRKYNQTLERLHQIYNEGQVTLLPNHCLASFEAWHET